MGEENQPLELFSSIERLLAQANFPEMSGKTLMDVARLMVAYGSVVTRLTNGELRIVEVTADATP